MSVAVLTNPATEQGTYAITIPFTDENGDPATPNSGLTWTLTDLEGTVVNARSAVAIASASTIVIVLSGADLAVDDELYLGKARKLVVEGTVTTDLGANLPLKVEVEFYITDLTKIT